MANLQKEIRHAADCLAVAIKSIREDGDIDGNERTNLIAESESQFTKYVSGLAQAQIEKKTSSDDSGDPANDLFPEGKRPRFFNASGYGPTHQKLWILFDNIRRQKGGHTQDGSAFQEAWASLSDTEKQAVRDEEKQAESARQALAEAEEKQRQNEMNKEYTVMVKAAHAISAGTIENTLRKSTWHTELRKMAADRQEDSETVERAVARLVKTDADALALFRASLSGVADDVPPAPTPVAVAKINSATEAIRKLAADLMGADPKLTKLDALVRIHNERPDLSAAAKAA